MDTPYNDITNLLHYTPFNPLNSRPLTTPIFQTSTFYFDNFKQIDDIFSLKERNFIYTRGGNPTVNLLEQRLAQLEDGIDGVCFSSGMGAISSVLFSLLKAGDTIIVSDVLYGSAMTLIQHILGKLGITVTVVDFSNYEVLEKEVQKASSPAVLYFETPCNPTLKLIDIQKVSQIGKKYNAKTVVDNTFATPYNQKPLNLGADVVVHSLTKYLNGHGDALGGVAISKDQGYIDMLKFMYMCEIGSVMDPNTAFLILRGLQTFFVRMKQHTENAIAVAEFLATHPSIEKVIFPSLSTYEYTDIYKTQMKGPGAIISFYLKGADVPQVRDFITKLKLFKLAVSLGDTESLVEYPLYMTHREYLTQIGTKPYEEMKALIRLSIGLEHSKDLIDDLKQALQ